MTIWLIILNLLFYQESKGNGVFGTEITYECLGEGTVPNTVLYKITFIRYQSCGYPTNSVMTLQSFNSDLWISPNNNNTNDIINPPLPLDTIVSVLNPNFPCAVLSDTLCISKAIFSDIYQFPISENSYYISSSKCCRPMNVDNILPPFLYFGMGNFIEITPIAQENCNNSPIFTNFPPTIICKDELLSIQISAEDTDGDQLIYELYNPMDWGATLATDSLGFVINNGTPPPYPPIPYDFPEFSFLYPFGESVYQSFEPTTGELEVIPNQAGYYLIGFQVSEFRNGQLLSTVYRDFLVNVVDCTPKVTAHLAAGTHNDLTNTYTINLCTDTVTLNNESTYEAFIQEHQWLFDFEVTNVADTAWSPFLTFPDAGVFTGQLVLNPDSLCTDTATVVFNVTTELQADFAVEYDTCVGGPVSFFNQSSINGGTIQQYDWSLGDGDSLALVNPVHTYAAPGEYEVELRIENEYGCQDSLWQSFLWQPAPPVIVVAPSEQEGCRPLAVRFENLSTPVDSTYQVLWGMGDGGISAGVSPNYSYENTGIYSVYVAITSPIGCFIDTVFTDLITVVSPPQADFSWNPEVVSNLQKEVFFQNESTGNLQNFWTIDGQTNIFGASPNYEFAEAGIYNIQLLIRNEYGCVDSLSKQLTVVKDYTYYLPNAFTPNEDGNNELLKGKGIFAGITQFEMRVWNRYGEQVFLTKNINEGWNGRRFNTGRMLTQGVYICQVQFLNEQGKQVKFQEKVTLLQ